MGDDQKIKKLVKSAIKFMGFLLLGTPTCRLISQARGPVGPMTRGALKKYDFGENHSMKKQLEKRFLKILLLWPLSLVALLVDGSDFSRADTSCPGKNQFLRQELTSRGAGILQGIHVTEAARVEEGALILSLDDRLLAAGLKEAQAALDMARVGEKMARDGFERIKKLKGGDSVSQQQIVESQLRLSQSTAAVD